VEIGDASGLQGVMGRVASVAGVRHVRRK
jgi:hypothetical protein